MRRTELKRGNGFGPRNTPLPRSKTPFRGSMTPFPAARASSAASARKGAAADSRGSGTGSAVQRETEASEFPPEVRALISKRDGGCVLRGNAAWGACWGPVDAHHRKLKGQGGSTAPETHTASNGISLCRGHHDAVHCRRAIAQSFGLIISRYWNPACTLVSFDNGRAWWGLTRTGLCLPALPCRDCGELDRTGEEPCEWYMVHDELWAASGMGPGDGHLCIGCLENRLGRQLVPADFSDWPVNQPPFGNITARLLDRLGYGGDAV